MQKFFNNIFPWQSDRRVKKFRGINFFFVASLAQARDGKRYVNELGIDQLIGQSIMIRMCRNWPTHPNVPFSVVDSTGSQASSKLTER
jgi:hypothetical protein